jgi:hypothetical protein
MKTQQRICYEPWPALEYEEFKQTEHLLHMGLQAIGKQKLVMPFEPQWANVTLFLTSSGVTTGPIFYHSATYAINVDFINHEVICKTSWGNKAGFKIVPMSVSQFTETLFNMLRGIGIDVTIDSKPREIPNPIPFEQDTQPREYNPMLVNTWWRIMLSSWRVMEQYHARFNGKTPPVGLMWGTLDLRDARYNLKSVPIVAPNTDYIRRNAMNEAQIESGWWAGNPAYPRGAYYSFTFPQPKGIESAKIKPAAARWEKSLSEFILDYDDVRNSKEPEKDLLAFLESTYQVGAALAGWDPHLIGSGKPV